MNKKLMAAIMFVAVLLQVAKADVPFLINYQGRLLDSGGNPVTSTNVMAIKIYAADVGGSALYSETIGSVAVLDGSYSFQFGTNIAIFVSALSGPQAWLQLSIDTTNLWPRQRLVSVPYALTSAGVVFPSGTEIKQVGGDLVVVSSDGSTNRILTSSLPYQPNRPPVAVDDTAMVKTNGAVTISVLDNDTDPDGDMLAIKTADAEAGRVFGAAKGTNTWTATTITYSNYPPYTYTGDVHFAYVVQDGRGGEATGTVYVTISENVTPSNMVFIPSAGTQFIMGDNNRVGSNANQEPAHTVKFTYSFYLDKYEVSWSLWKSVYSWALAHGYTFEEYAAKGKGDDYPVYGVGWIDCLKWLNARSEMEGLTPVYYTSASHTSGNVVRSGLATSIPPENCIKDGNGWRLPTEAEWEYAARGGVQSYYPYPGTSPDPRYATYTPNTTWCKVADNLPGNFGLYNMAGDVYEWCYELFYQYTSATQTDPWLPGTLLSSKDHISRGGNFMSEAWRTACCARKPYSDNWSRTKDINDLQHGFRCARTTVD